MPIVRITNLSTSEPVSVRTLRQDIPPGEPESLVAQFTLLPRESGLATIHVGGLVTVIDARAETPPCLGERYIDILADRARAE